MKIIRFRTGDSWPHGHSYAYIRANWFERRALRALMARHPNLMQAAHWPGPRNWRAQFVLSAKPISGRRRFHDFLGGARNG